MFKGLSRKIFFSAEPVVTAAIAFGRAIRHKNGAGFLPILMYHSIAENVPDTCSSYYDVRVTRACFAEQMQYLHEHDYTVLALDQYRQIRQQHLELPDKAVVITFDDGYEDNFIHAFPVLSKYGFIATIFLAVDFIGTDKSANFVSPGVGIERTTRFLTWEQVREMHTHNIRFGSHTMSHPKLYGMPQPDIEYEIGESRGIIEDKLGSAVTSFCFPYAFPGTNQKQFCQQIYTVLTDAGYQEGVTTLIGRNSPSTQLLFLQRIPVHAGDTISRFAAKLNGAYDWVGSIQTMTKAASG